MATPVIWLALRVLIYLNSPKFRLEKRILDFCRSHPLPLWMAGFRIPVLCRIGAFYPVLDSPDHRRIQESHSSGPPLHPFPWIIPYMHTVKNSFDHVSIASPSQYSSRKRAKYRAHDLDRSPPFADEGLRGNLRCPLTPSQIVLSLIILTIL